MQKLQVFIAFSGMLALATTFVCSNVSAQEIDRVMPVARVLTVVDAEVLPYETYTHPKPIVGVAPEKYKPNYLPENRTAYGMTQKVISRHDVGCLEFTYKPLRSMAVEVPQPSGKMRRKVITYLVYRVRNRGGHLTTEEVEDEFGYDSYKIVSADQISQEADIEHFQPHIVLEGWAEDFNAGEEVRSKYVKKSYLETYHPYVVEQIERVDRTPGKLHDWKSMSQIDLAVSKGENALGTWGVAIWEDVDPTINYMSIYVQGLTNAFRVSEKLDGSAVFQHKTLQLNFWRAGNEKRIEDDVVVNGIPLSRSVKEQAVYARFYALPGPAIRGYEMEVGSSRSLPLFQIDAKFDKEFNSEMLGTLNKDQLPEPVYKSFTELGIPVPKNTRLTNAIPNNRWVFQIRDGERDREFRVDHDPRYWVKEGKGVKILGQVENLWIYR